MSVLLGSTNATRQYRRKPSATESVVPSEINRVSTHPGANICLQQVLIPALQARILQALNYRTSRAVIGISLISSLFLRPALSSAFLVRLKSASATLPRSRWLSPPPHVKPSHRKNCENSRPSKIIHEADDNDGLGRDNATA